MTTTLSKTQLSTLQKRAAHNGVLLWEDGGWRYPDGIISDAPYPDIPDSRTMISGIEDVISLGAASDDAYSVSGMGVHMGYACSTDRYRAYSVTYPSLDGQDVYLSVNMCKTLIGLFSTRLWKDSVAYAWQDGTQTYVQVGSVLLSAANGVRSAEYVVSTVRKLFANLNDYRDTGIPFPIYEDAPYQAAYEDGKGWVALPSSVTYEDVRRAYLQVNNPLIVFDGGYADDAGRFSRGNMHVSNTCPGGKAVYARTVQREALVMPVRI
jgi:hypothetical protein